MALKLTNLVGIIESNSDRKITALIDGLFYEAVDFISFPEQVRLVFQRIKSREEKIEELKQAASDALASPIGIAARERLTAALEALE